MKLTEIKQILADKGWRLTRSLGQNLLHDGNQVRRIIKAAELEPADSVVEIGPGLGPLTELLVQKVERVLGVEKDRRLLGFLQERFAHSKGLTLMHADALSYLRDQHTDWSDWKLVANLPYSVASPILVEFAMGNSGPRRMVVTLQLEVAQRLVAEPGSREYGILSLLIQRQYEPRGWFKIPASCFFPEPDVDSACVTLVRRPISLLRSDQTEVFSKIVKRGFSQRRKMMIKLLKEDWAEDRVREAFAAALLQASARAETASLTQFVQLTRHLHP